MSFIVNAHHLHLTPDSQQRAAETLNRLGGEPISLRTESGAELPEEIEHIVRHVLNAVARGEEISVSTLPEFVSPNTAAAMLSVSRPTVMKYIEEGHLSANTVGTHFKLSSAEVLGLAKEKAELRRQAVFDVMELEAELEQQELNRRSAG